MIDLTDYRSILSLISDEILLITAENRGGKAQVFVGDIKETIERAIKAEIDLVDYRRGAAYMTKQIQDLEAENAKLRAALSKVEDMCVSFHEGGPYQDNEEVRRIMEIYDIAHSALEGGGADG